MMTPENNSYGRHRFTRQLKRRLRQFQPPVRPDLESKLLAEIPASITPQGERRPLRWLYPAAGFLAAATVLIVVLLHVNRQPTQPPALPIGSPGMTNETIDSAVQREYMSARLLASTRILAEQAGSQKGYVRDSLDYIVQAYPETLAAKEVLAANTRSGE